MKKTDKKIISIFLLIIMLLSQFSMIFATENEEEPTKTLSQYLIENGVDENGDGELSDAEWAKVKKLSLNNIDLTGIEKAVNLRELWMEKYDCTNIDFSELENLEYLKLDYCDNLTRIEKLVNLKSLDLYECDFENIDFSKLGKLEDLNIYSDDILQTNKKNIDISELENLKSLILSCKSVVKFPKFNNLNYIYLVGEVNSDGILDLESCENIGGVININVDFSKIKINPNTMILDYRPGYELINLEDEIEIVKGGAYTIRGFGLKSNENNNIAVLNENVNLWGYTEIEAKNVGTTNMTLKDVLGKEKTIKINVYEKPQADQQLENTGLSAEIICDPNGYRENAILKSNGELWKTTSETTAEIIDTNVKECIIDEVLVTGLNYVDPITGFNNVTFVTNTLKKDNSLTIDFEGITKKVSNVQQIENNVYLTTDGKLYEIGLNYITEEINPKLIKENVKKLLGDCIVLDDGTTWYQDTGGSNITSNVTFKKLADFEIKDMGYVDGKSTVVDNQNNLWGCKDKEFYFNDSGLEKIQENFEIFEGYELYWAYQTPDGIELLENGDAVLTYYSEEENKDLLGETILTSVTQIDYNDSGEGYVLIRTDGTIWTYSDRTGLTKITKSTPGGIDNDNNKKEEFLKPTAQINSKELGDSTVISGISNNTDVKSFINQNNFNNEYGVKIYDKNNKEITGEELLATGSIVKLYKEGKMVKEYVVVIYGDTTGDGKITAVDALALIKHINNKILFTKEVYLEAGRVRQASGINLTAVDALAIIKGVNGKFAINQKK